MRRRLSRFSDLGKVAAVGCGTESDDGKIDDEMDSDDEMGSSWTRTNQLIMSLVA